VTLQTADGRTLEADWGVSLISDNDGAPIGVVSFAHDISERKAAERVVERRNRELRKLNRIVHELSRAQDPEELLPFILSETLAALERDAGWMKLSSPAAGTPGNALEARTTRHGSRCLSPDREGWLHRRVEETLRLVALSESGPQASHQPQACPVLAVPLLERDTPVGILGVCGTREGRPQDFGADEKALLSAIGHQVSVMLENAALWSQVARVEMLTELDRLRSELIANVSHDLRTPLGLIKMSASTLLRDDVAMSADVQRDLLGDIQAQADRLANLIDGILDLDAIQSGRLNLHITRFDLAPLLSDAVGTARRRGTKHVIESSASTSLWVRGDRPRISQVVHNLIDNALKYTPEEGRIGVSADRDADKAVVEISDTGIGIPSEALDLVFERFYRVRHPETQHIGGLGIGLAASKGIVEAHGGSIWVDSQPGRGSTFTFTLPLPEPLPEPPSRMD
jgi:signal transduction histidine kinase